MSLCLMVGCLLGESRDPLERAPGDLSARTAAAGRQRRLWDTDGRRREVTLANSAGDTLALELRDRRHSAPRTGNRDARNADANPNAISVGRCSPRAVRPQCARGEALPLEDLREDRRPASPSAENEAIDAEVPSLRRAHAVLAAVVDVGAVTRVSAAVVWRTRVQQDDGADVAAELGMGVRTLQRRRQRAERQLAAVC